MIWGQFKCITFIVHFISITITSAPSQIIMHQIPKIGEPFSKAQCHYLLSVCLLIERTQQRVEKNTNKSVDSRCGGQSF